MCKVVCRKGLALVEFLSRAKLETAFECFPKAELFCAGFVGGGWIVSESDVVARISAGRCMPALNSC